MVSGSGRRWLKSLLAGREHPGPVLVQIISGIISQKFCSIRLEDMLPDRCKIETVPDEVVSDERILIHPPATFTAQPFCKVIVLIMDAVGPLREDTDGVFEKVFSRISAS